MLRKVSEHSNLMRDMSTGAIINVDNTGYNSYVSARDRITSQADRLNNLEGQVAILLQEIANFKQIIKTSG